MGLLGVNRYDILLLDPPYRYRSASHHKSKVRGGNRGHYPTLSFKELSQLDMQKIAMPDSVMFLWATAPMLPDQIRLMESWGWSYKTIAFAWLKVNKNNPRPHMGTGYYTRGSTEYVLLGTRGAVLHPESKSVLQVVVDRIKDTHGEKTTIVQDRIDEMYPDYKKAELFATRRRKDWHCYGLAIDGNDVRDYLKKTGESE